MLAVFDDKFRKRSFSGTQHQVQMQTSDVSYPQHLALLIAGDFRRLWKRSGTGSGVHRGEPWDPGVETMWDPQVG